MANYSQWWESFAGGEWDESTLGAISPDEEATNYLDRTRAFYSDVVGPSWGYEEGFGNVFGDYLASFDVSSMQQAEETFRMSIGDIYKPTGSGLDPFGWERLSRMSPTEAQAQLAGELYGEGDILGGTTGAEYGTAMAKGAETYTSGLQAEREKLTYEGLTGSQSIASGTSGSVLRTSAGITQSEDILAEAYKKAQTLGAEHKESKKTTALDLQTNLDDALTTYLDAVDKEKERWFNNVMGDVHRAETTYGIEFGEERKTQAQLDPEGEWDVGETYWGEDEPWVEVCGSGDYGSVEACKCHNFGECSGWWDYLERQDLPMEDYACGVGELFNPATNLCEPAEDLGLSVDQDGLMCPGTVDECGVCDGPGPLNCFDGTTSCDNCMTSEDWAELMEGFSIEGFTLEGFDLDWGLDLDFDWSGMGYDCNGVLGGTAVVDECGVCGGDNTSCEQDCAGAWGGSAVYDDCGVCGGDGSSCAYIYGCTAPSALNYDPEATMSDGTCIYPEEEDDDNNDGYVSCGNQGDCPYWAPWCIGGQCSADPENPAGTGAGGPQM